jgi:acetyl-CoA carboxylase alpha subunit
VPESQYEEEIKKLTEQIEKLKREDAKSKDAKVQKEIKKLNTQRQYMKSELQDQLSRQQRTLKYLSVELPRIFEESKELSQ